VSANLRSFFAHSFAPDPINAQGEKDPSGISDLQLADLVANWIKELSHDRIEVVRTQDPHRNYISSQVRRDISSSDVMLCLFTMRTKDHLKSLWLPSTYVVSEASAALMQYPSEHETHARLFGLVEDTVDPEQLGMAFHRNKTIETFRRDNLDGLRTKVEKIVRTIIDSGVTPRDLREYLSLDKSITVWRSGAVTVECRHRFRFTDEVQRKLTIPHAIWRVSEPLPDYRELLNGARDVRRGYLRCVRVECGQSGQRNGRCRIVGTPKKPNNEYYFDVEFSDLVIYPGDELTYEIAWGYRNAFHDPSKQDGRPNSVGIRTGERGMVTSASLTLRFQRDLGEDAHDTEPILEDYPTLFTTDAPLLPANAESFWHDSQGWKNLGKLLPCSKRSGALWEVYHWTATCFRGTAKVIWTPCFNYFQDDTDASVPAREQSTATNP
jgi:hypothetical protein